MKLLILHLSDLHIKDASTWDCVKQDALLQSLNEYNGKVDDCLIVITGDIAYSGKRNQYCQANKICSKILSSVCSRLGINKYLRIVVVPGNHDMDFIKIERDDKYIYDLIESGDNTKIKEQMEKDITALSDFFDFTDKRKCLWKNKLFNKINLSYKDINLSINMVNSAVFSLLSPDKGVHYLPTNYFDEMFLKEDDSNDRHSIVLTVMHHHPEWFHENIKSDFVEKIIESSSILMLGHEHRNSERCITTDTYDSISVIAGGVLSGDNLNRSTYNILIMDTDQMIIDNYCYEWDEHYHLYHKKNIVSSKTELHYKEYNFNRLSISDKYEEYLKYDDKSCLERTTSYFDYFVFPRLVKKGQYNYIEGKEITKWESLKEIIEKDKYISIFGDENSGKTTLAKYIAYNLLKKNTVLYITSEDINGKHIGKTIKNVFEDQYSSESLTFAKFNQIEKKYKVAIVDDIHKIKYSDLTMLVEFLKEDFGYILLTSKNKIEFDISDEAKQKILGDEFIEYNISPFYSEKRVQLIEKVANVLNVKKSNDVAQSINNFIKVQLKVFKTDPSFIIKYVRYFLLKAEGTTNKQDVFNEVFESNIIQSIQNSKAREPISKVMKILEEIAYYIHINKQYPIDYDDINRVIKSYNEDYDFTVNTTYLVESLETGRILKKVSGDNKYYFTDTNYLAFFVARKIYAEYSNTGKTIEIEKALNNICFGINSEIILFLSYITKTIALLSILIKKAEDHVFKWETLNLTKNDIDFLSKNRTILLESPSKQEKQVAEREQVHSEEIAQDHKIDIVEIYDYDESETKTFQNQIITSIKYLQILARILPNFTHLLKREPKSKLVQDIYIYPNKILHKVLSSYDLNEVVSELLKEVNKHEENKITRDKMEELVYEMVIILILSLYNMAMSIAADKNTQDNLNNNIPKEEGNITYSIQNLMMDDVLGNVDKFIKKIDTLQKEDISNNILIQNILRIIVKHFLVVNKNIPQPKEQRLKDKFFPKNNSIKNIAIKSQL